MTSRSTDSSQQPVSPTISDASVNPPKNKDEPERGQWGNKFEFILASLGMSVGIGNIWRYSALAYENGGSAFLIPYITCSLLFAFPIVYAEFTMGQYSRTGPAKALKYYAPACQGLGWAMWLIATPVAIYYAIVVAWSMIYLAFVISGKSPEWNTCKNTWNTPNCVTIQSHMQCRNISLSAPYASNKTGTIQCLGQPDENVTGAAEEFFINYVTTRSDGIENFEAMNWPMFIAICVLYTMVFITLSKGMKLVGKITVPLPYLVLIIFLIRGVTLDGASEGIKFYLFEPDWSKLFSYKTWTAALAQVCFSIGLGYGSLMSMSSYSHPTNNCFRDAMIIVIGDSLMSIIGGVAAFSILGYVSVKTGKPIQSVIQSGPSLAFIAYPEAVNTLPWPALWSFLFFIMLFLLGFSSQIAYVDMVITFCYDLFPRLKKCTWAVALFFCIGIAACSSFMANNAQWYWFNLLSEFSATVAPCVVAGMEVAVLIYIYGWKNVREDMEEMHGEMPRSHLSRFFSRFSSFFRFSWAVFCPGMAIMLIVTSMLREIPMKIGIYEIPVWAEVIGWVLNLGPLVPIPLFFFINWYRNKRDNNVLFRPMKQLPSYKRIYPETEESEENKETVRESEGEDC